MKISSPELVNYRIPHLVVGIIIVILNLIEIIILARMKEKRRVYETLLLSLSIIDLSHGLLEIVVYIFLNEQHIFLEFEYLFHLFLVSSVLHLICIAINRLWAIWKPIHYKMRWTKRKVRVNIAVIWVLTLVITVVIYVFDVHITRQPETPVEKIPPQDKGTSHQCNTSNEFENKELENLLLSGNGFSSSLKMTLVIVVIIADVFLIVITSIIVCLMQQRKKDSSTLYRTSKIEDKASVVCVLITVTFIVFTLPSTLTYIITNNANITVNVLLDVNCAVNSIVYFFRGRFQCFSREQKYAKDNGKIIVLKSCNSFD